MPRVRCRSCKRSPAQKERTRTSSSAHDARSLLGLLFPRDAAGGDYAVVLVGRDQQSRATVAHVVPHKGADHEWIAEQCARDLLRFGLHGSVVLKSDQENAVVDVLREVAKIRGEARTVLDQSPVGDSQGNGVTARAVQAIEKLVRVHKLSFENRVKAKLSSAQTSTTDFKWEPTERRRCRDYAGSVVCNPSSRSARLSCSGSAARSKDL